MSRAQNTSSPSLENLLSNVVKNTDLINPRSKAITLEAYQRYIEYLDEILENPPSFDESVIVKVEGKAIKFPNSEALAEFLMEMK